MINDNLNIKKPAEIDALIAATQAIGFTALCEEKTGVLLRTLAATKAGGRFLEIGTGTGVSTAWILDGLGMGKLTTIELESATQAIARQHLGHHANVEFVLGDANTFIDGITGHYDFVFADTFPGKFTNREKVLASVAKGGFYIIDDLLPQVNWPQDDHPLNVRALIADLEADQRFHVLKMTWASGLMVCVRK